MALYSCLDLSVGSRCIAGRKVSQFSGLCSAEHHILDVIAVCSLQIADHCFTSCSRKCCTPFCISQPYAVADIIYFFACFRSIIFIIPGTGEDLEIPVSVTGFLDGHDLGSILCSPVRSFKIWICCKCCQGCHTHSECQCHCCSHSCKSFCSHNKISPLKSIRVVNVKRLSLLII